MRSNRIILVAFSFLIVFAIISCRPVSEAVFETPELISSEESIPSPTLEPTQNDLEQEEMTGSILTLWHPWSGETAELIDRLVDLFNRENTLTITINSVSRANKDELIADLSAAFEGEGQIPHLIVSTSQSIRSWYLRDFPIQEIDDSLFPEGNNSSENQIETIFPLFRNIDVVDDVRIGVPAYQSGHFIFYNQSWAKELGFEAYPKTIEEFKEQSCAAVQQNLYDSQSENDGMGGWIFNGDTFSILSWMRVFNGGTLIGNRSQPIIKEQGNIDAITFLIDFYLDDCAWWQEKEAQPYNLFSTRKALFFSGKMEDMFQQLDFDKANNNLDEWILIPYPSDSGKPLVMVEGLSFAVTTEDESSKKAALEFVNWMMQPVVQAEIIRNTGVFPLSNTVIEVVDPEMENFSVWKNSLQFLPFAQAEPVFDKWYVIQKVLEDIGLQIVRYIPSLEEVESLLAEAEALAGGLDLE